MSDFGSSSSSFSLSSREKRKTLHRCINRDWSGLPRNVLFDIMDKLTVIDDYVRFGGVCRSWRTIFIEENSETKFNKHCSQPFLLIPIELTETTSETTTKTSLYSLSTNKVYNLHFQLTGNKSFRGSTHGWLVTMETKGVDNHHVQLQNPFLSQDRTIDLPTLDNLVQQHGDLNNDWGHYYLCKAVLSADPSSSRDFTVMAIMSQYRGLAFFKSGNTSWTSIGREWRQEWKQQVMFQDVIFFHKTNQFYALRYNGQVLAIDLEGQGREPKLTQVVPPLRACSIKSYLVEDLSSGDLLLVSKKITTGFDPQTLLKVFKLHPVNQHWIRMHNLGGKILFLGNNSSMLRSSSDCPGCQPNCVYYTNDVISRSYGTQGRMPKYYDGIYNLNDGTNRPHYSPPTKNFSSYTKTLSSPIWLDPTVLVVSTSMVL